MLRISFFNLIFCYVVSKYGLSVFFLFFYFANKYAAIWGLLISFVSDFYFALMMYRIYWKKKRTNYDANSKFVIYVGVLLMILCLSGVVLHMIIEVFQSTGFYPIAQSQIICMIIAISAFVITFTHLILSLMSERRASLIL